MRERGRSRSHEDDHDTDCGRSSISNSGSEKVWGVGVMTTHATLSNAFTRAAIKFMVAESDFLVMSQLGVDNFEAMTYIDIQDAQI